MFETRYRIRLDGGDPTMPLRYTGALAMLRRKLRRHPRGRHYRFRYGEMPWGPAQLRVEVMRRMAWRMPRLETGEVARIQVGNHEYSVRAVRVKVPDPGPPEATPQFGPYDLDDVHPDVQTLCRIQAGYDLGVRCNGLAFTRPVGWSGGESWWAPGRPLPPGASWSNHSRRRAWACKGGAADTVFPLPMPTGSDMGRMDRLVRYMVELAQEGQLPPSTEMFIWRDRYYQDVNGFEPRYYSGAYHYHLHSQIRAPYEVCN